MSDKEGVIWLECEVCGWIMEVWPGEERLLDRCTCGGTFVEVEVKEEQDD